MLTDAQRAGFRRFLGSEGYDTANEDLMLNEAQAYLVHTPDPRYFLPEPRRAERRGGGPAAAVYLGRGMPDGWLKTATAGRRCRSAGGEHRSRVNGHSERNHNYGSPI